MQSTKSGIAPKLYQRACDALEADIRNGAISAGRRLTETAIAERFGISRAPARQALTELEQLGLVRKAETRGYDVLAGTPSAYLDSPVQKHNIDRRLHTLSSWEVIYSDVEIEIVSRTSLASWRINEALLAKHYGVSRTVARDVVARLQQRGIVQKDDKSHWIAQALTTQHIEELYELRWTLEPLALEKAVPNLPHGFLDRLQANVERAIASIDTVNGKMLDAMEQELHVELLGYCGNNSLMRAISLPQALLVAHHFLYHWTMELFDSEPFLPEHLAIIECLKSGDTPGAKQALVHHLQISRARAMMRIQSVASTISPTKLTYLKRIDRT